MKSKIFVLIFGVFFIISFIGAVTIESGTVLNTSISNSSIIFSFNITANNFTIESNYLLLYGINFTNGTGDYICDDVNHSTSNSNLDSVDFNCTLQTISSDDGETSIDGDSPGGGGFWTGVRESETSEELKLTIGVNKNNNISKEIKSDLTGIRKIQITSKDRIYGDIEIKPLKSIPQECNIEYDKTYNLYELLDIKESFNASKIESITLQWGIDNFWMQENNVSYIQVVKCYPKYEVLKTEKVNQTENKTHYDVHSDSFSMWAVLGIKDSKDILKESPGEFHTLDDKPKMGKWMYFLLGFLIMLILFFIFLLLKKKKK